MQQSSCLPDMVHAWRIYLRECMDVVWPEDNQPLHVS